MGVLRWSGFPVRELGAPVSGDFYFENVWALPAPIRSTTDFEKANRRALIVGMTLGIDLACRAAHVASLAGPDGTPEGFDVEIGKIIADELGISADKIQWVETVSQNREPFIQNGQVDIVVATYTINDTRSRSSTSPVPTTSPVSHSWCRRATRTTRRR